MALHSSLHSFSKSSPNFSFELKFSFKYQQVELLSCILFFEQRKISASLGSVGPVISRYQHFLKAKEVNDCKSHPIKASEQNANTAYPKNEVLSLSLRY